MQSTREGNGKALQYSCLKNPNEQYEKAKRQDTERLTPQVGRCPIAGVQPQWIRGILSGNGVGKDQETIA